MPGAKPHKLRSRTRQARFSMKNFQVPAILTRVGFTKDGGLSIGFHTNELSIEEKVRVSEFHNEFGFLLFKPNQFSEEEIPREQAIDGGKSSSKRLRDIIFIFWKQQGGAGEFESFYRRQMEKIIDKIKEQLDETT